MFGWFWALGFLATDRHRPVPEGLPYGFMKPMELLQCSVCFGLTSSCLGMGLGFRAQACTITLVHGPLGLVWCRVSSSDLRGIPPQPQATESVSLTGRGGAYP